MSASLPPPPAPPPLPWALAWRLAAGQLVAWGILYYTFTVVVGPMQADTGWSRAFLNTGLSLGLLAWGLAAVPVGQWIQHRGGRGLMTLASAAGGGALVTLGLTDSPALYLGAWLVLGSSLAGALYDPAFAVVTAAFGPHYRRGITLLTLVGGLASTVFVPLAQFSVDHLGWRHACVALGLFQILLGVPLHAWGIPPFVRDPARPPPGARPWPQRLAAWWIEFRRDLTEPRFVGLALWFTAHSAVFTGLIFQLVPMLQARGASNSDIVRAVAVIGPLQVVARFLLAARASEFSTLRIGRWTIAGTLAALAVLLLLPPDFGWLALFAALFGASNGVSTILRGTAIAELFGRERYAALNGALSAPAVVGRASAPLLLASLWTATGEPRSVVAALFVVMLAGAAGLLLTARAVRAGGTTDAR